MPSKHYEIYQVGAHTETLEATTYKGANVTITPVNGTASVRITSNAGYQNERTYDSQQSISHFIEYGPGQQATVTVEVLEFTKIKSGFKVVFAGDHFV